MTESPAGREVCLVCCSHAYTNRRLANVLKKRSTGTLFTPKSIAEHFCSAYTARVIRAAVINSQNNDVGSIEKITRAVRTEEFALGRPQTHTTTITTTTAEKHKLFSRFPVYERARFPTQTRLMTECNIDESNAIVKQQSHIAQKLLQSTSCTLIVASQCMVCCFACCTALFFSLFRFLLGVRYCCCYLILYTMYSLARFCVCRCVWH